MLTIYMEVVGSIVCWLLKCDFLQRFNVKHPRRWPSSTVGYTVIVRPAVSQ